MESSPISTTGSKSFASPPDSMASSYCLRGMMQMLHPLMSVKVSPSLRTTTVTKSFLFMSLLYLRLAEKSSPIVHGADRATVTGQDAMVSEVDAHRSLAVFVRPHHHIEGVQVSTKAILGAPTDRSRAVDALTGQIIGRQPLHADAPQQPTKTGGAVPFGMFGREELKPALHVPLNLDRHAGLIPPVANLVGLVAHLNQLPDRRRHHVHSSQLLPFVCTDGVPLLRVQLQRVLVRIIGTGIIPNKLCLGATIGTLQATTNLLPCVDQDATRHGRLRGELGVVHTASIPSMLACSRGSARIRERKTRFLLSEATAQSPNNTTPLARGGLDRVGFAPHTSVLRPCLCILDYRSNGGGDSVPTSTWRGFRSYLPPQGLAITSPCVPDERRRGSHPRCDRAQTGRGSRTSRTATSAWSGRSPSPCQRGRRGSTSAREHRSPAPRSPRSAPRGDDPRDGSRCWRRTGS